MKDKRVPMSEDEFKEIVGLTLLCSFFCEVPRGFLYKTCDGYLDVFEFHRSLREAGWR